MRANLVKYCQAAFAVVTLIGFLWLGYWVLGGVLEVVSRAKPEVVAALVVGASTIIVSLLSVLVSNQLARTAEARRHLREQKIPLYKGIIDFMFSFTFAEKVGKKAPDEKQIIKWAAEVIPDLIVWGDDNVLKSFQKFRSASLNVDNQEAAEPLKILYALEDFILEIRKDLGHKNTKLKKGDILSLFINDIQDHLD